MSSGDRGALLTWKAMKTWLIGVVDTGVREGITTSEAQRMKELKREVKELRRANEILKLARMGRQNFCNVSCGILLFPEHT